LPHVVPLTSGLWFDVFVSKYIRYTAHKADSLVATYIGVFKD